MPLYMLIRPSKKRGGTGTKVFLDYARKSRERTPAWYVAEAPQEFDEEKKELDADAQVWKTYVREADRVDEELVDGWNKSMDVNLIFAALFSAISTAFVIESYKKLQQDPADLSAQTLLVISQTLTSLGNGSQTANAPPTPDMEGSAFKAPPTTVLVNVLWFLSLSLSVAVSLVSMLAKEWCLEFMSGRIGPPGPQARRRQRRWDGIVEWKMKEVVVMLPSLIHLSLLLFAVGLCVFLWDVHFGVAIPVIIVTALAAGAYFSCTILPFIYDYCPYGTVLSRLYKQFSDRHSQSTRDTMTQDETTSRALGWMIVNCETPRSVDVALQSLAAAEDKLPPEPLEKCDAWTLIRQRMEANDGTGEQAKSAISLYKRALGVHMWMRRYADGLQYHWSNDLQSAQLILGVQSCINSVVYKLLEQLSPFDRNRSLLEECILVGPRVLEFECKATRWRSPKEQRRKPWMPLARRAVQYDMQIHADRSESLAQEITQLLVCHMKGEIDMQPLMQRVLSASLAVLLSQKAVTDPLVVAGYALQLIRACLSPSQSDTNAVSIRMQTHPDADQLNKDLVGLLLGVLLISQCDCAIEPPPHFSPDPASDNSEPVNMSRSAKVVEMAWTYLMDFVYPGTDSFDHTRWVLHGGFHLLMRAETYHLGSEDCRVISNVMDQSETHYYGSQVEGKCASHHIQEFAAAVTASPDLEALTPQLTACLKNLGAVTYNLKAEYIHLTPEVYVLMLKSLCQSNTGWAFSNCGELLSRSPFPKASPQLVDLLSTSGVVSWLVESLQEVQKDQQAFANAQIWLLLSMCMQEPNPASPTPSKLEMLLNQHLGLDNDSEKQEDTMMDLETQLLTFLSLPEHEFYLYDYERAYLLRVLECMLQRRRTPLPVWAEKNLGDMPDRLRGLASFADLESETSHSSPDQNVPTANPDPTDDNLASASPDTQPTPVDGQSIARNVSQR